MIELVKGNVLFWEILFTDIFPEGGGFGRGIIDDDEEEEEAEEWGGGDERKKFLPKVEVKLGVVERDEWELEEDKLEEEEEWLEGEGKVVNLAILIDLEDIEDLNILLLSLSLLLSFYLSYFLTLLMSN